MKANAKLKELSLLPDEQHSADPSSAVFYLFRKRLPLKRCHSLFRIKTTLEKTETFTRHQNSFCNCSCLFLRILKTHN